MATYPKTAYGSNPNASRNPNNDYGWGGYQWPQGVPASLLGTLRFPGKLGTVIIVARKELLPLIGTLMALTEQKGYYFHPGWCWSYANRAVTGGKHPSNHSRGKAADFNAPNNPFSWAFKSDIPPAVVKLWETNGFYWGGRYVGQPTDAMHFEFVYTPADVARFYKSAAALLAAQEDDVTPQDKKDIINGVVAALKPVVTAAAKTAVLDALKQGGTVVYEDSRLRPTVPRSQSVVDALGLFGTYVSNASGGVDQLARAQGMEPEDRKKQMEASK